MLGTYLSAVLKKWLQLMSCAVFTALSAYIAKTHQTNHWFLAMNVVLAVVFLLTATFSVWKDEHTLLLKHTEKPNLNVAIKEVFVIPQRRSDVFVHVSIHNDSPVETAISKYRALVDVGTSSQYHLEGPLNDVSAYRRVDLDWGELPQYRVRGESLLKDLEMDSSQPLKRGLPAEGWLHFKVESGLDLPALTLEMIKSLSLVLWTPFDGYLKVGRKEVPLENPSTLIEWTGGSL
ncbi:MULTISPECIES: hypothetical protein [Acidobacteriaceae]|uniref:hypothetical protein n=1 Tax=Acidobacteriaceae TaxID=204434 RepID=UPI00131B8670|nr:MULTISPECIES: hypothetical protein [Acidobacteriaceae]MDW5266140.1 hypothetical protein [Edaphobacter sp.]